MKTVKYVLPSVLFSLMSIALMAQNEDRVTRTIKGNAEYYLFMNHPSENRLFICNARDPYPEAPYNDYYAREIKGYRIDSITKDKEFVNRYLKDAFTNPYCETHLLISFFYDLNGDLLSVCMSSVRKGANAPYNFRKLARAFERFEEEMKKYSKAAFVKSTKGETEIQFVCCTKDYYFYPLKESNPADKQK